jgi:hypothetical protein
MVNSPRNWQSSARGIATTVVVIAVALYFAVHLIESIATPLIVISAAIVVVIGAVAVVRARRSRW